MQTLEEFETQLLIEAIYKRYGYDYSQYQKTSLQRRFETHCRENGLKHISDMIPLVLHDVSFFRKLFNNLSVTVTEMFRDPVLFEKMRTLIVPFLKTYPYINIWNVGCATGEEAYSTAIVLNEEGVLNKSQIYATDINEVSLQKARKGIYSIKEVKLYTKNYNDSGGKLSLSDYYYSRYNGIMMNSSLKKKITFSAHNLVTDGVFSEMQLIMCKNVLIYFNTVLQERVLKLLCDSLCYNGFLCLGDKESLEFSAVAKHFELIDKDARIYQKKFPV